MTANARQSALNKAAALSHEQRLKTIDANIASFQQHQQEQKALIDAASEIGDRIDISQLRLSEVDGHTKAMNQSIAELIIGLDASAMSIEGTISEIQQQTLSEKLVGFFSDKKAAQMRETRVRNADISDNLNNLLTKSDLIVGMLQGQLDVIVQQKGAVTTGLSQVQGEREEALAKMQAVTAQLDAAIPELTALQEQIRNEAEPARRAELDSQFTVKNAAYNEAKMQEQELLSQSQTLEAHAKTYEIYLNSLQTQEATQRVLLNKIKTDTRERMIQWSAMMDSMKTANLQDNAHKINDVGVAVDKKGREVMAGIAVGAERRMGDMLASHAGNMQHAQFVQDQRRKAEAEFEQVFGKIVAEHDSGAYAQS